MPGHPLLRGLTPMSADAPCRVKTFKDMKPPILLDKQDDKLCAGSSLWNTELRESMPWNEPAKDEESFMYAAYSCKKGIASSLAAGLGTINFGAQFSIGKKYNYHYVAKGISNYQVNATPAAFVKWLKVNSKHFKFDPDQLGWIKNGGRLAKLFGKKEKAFVPILHSFSSADELGYSENKKNGSSFSFEASEESSNAELVFKSGKNVVERTQMWAKNSENPRAFSVSFFALPVKPVQDTDGSHYEFDWSAKKWRTKSGAESMHDIFEENDEKAIETNLENFNASFEELLLDDNDSDDDDDDE